MKAFNVLLLSLSLLSSALSYSEDEAIYAVDMAGSAYCAGTLGHGIENWDCA